MLYSRNVDTLELLLLTARRARVALDDVLGFDDFVTHEVLVLRALAHKGHRMSGREIAHALGWTDGRVSQVVKSLLARGLVERARHASPRCRAVALTRPGADEALQFVESAEVVARPLLECLSEHELSVFRGGLRRVAEQSEKLPRGRSPCQVA